MKDSKIGALSAQDIQELANAVMNKINTKEMYQAARFLGLIRK